MTLYTSSDAAIGQVNARNNGRVGTGLFALLVTSILLFHFGGFIDRASPSLIDDHEILWPLSANSTATAAQVWADLKNTDEYQEVRESGRAHRFRPAFYPIRSIQIYLWGGNTRLWYISMFLMYVATAASLFWLIQQHFGLAIAALFGVFYFGHRTWSDLLPRIGPLEIQSMPFVVLLIWLAWRAIDRGKPFWFVSMIPVASLLCAMKEANIFFMIAIGSLLLVCGLLARNRRMMLSGAIPLLAGIVVLGFFLRLTANVSTTGLVSPRGPIDLYVRFWVGDRTHWLAPALLAMVSAAAIGTLLGRLKTSWGEIAALFVATLSIEAMRLTIYYITYANSFAGAVDSLAMRYGYTLALMQALTAAIVFGRICLAAQPVWSLGFRTAAVACIAALLVVNHGLLAPEVMAGRDWWAAYNGSADEAITKAGALIVEARKQGRDPMLLASGPSLDWEPALSLIQFLHRLYPTETIWFDPGQEPVSTGYAARSILLGGTPLDPAARSKLQSCVDVHVDVEDGTYTNPGCEVVRILLRPRPFY